MYTDLSPTQYALALDWLRDLGVVIAGPHVWGLAPAMKELPPHEAALLVLGRALEAAAPPWLAESDILVRDADDLPEDASCLATTLGVPATEALRVVRQVHGRVHLAERSRLGAAGETALVNMLDATWPGSAHHVALTDDGFGYDVVFTTSGASWHLEVKTTTRRGRLAIYLSRHEYEVSVVDSMWRLVIVGLDSEGRPCAVATVRSGLVTTRAPRDSPGGRWESAQYQLRPADLRPGLSFLDADGRAAAPGLLYDGSERRPSPFAWMPDGPTS